MEANQHHLTSVEAIREIVGQPHPATPLKVLNELDEMAIAFIRRSPFVVLATADGDGCPDVSPKGDEPGFVVVADAKTLLLPERKGNRLLFSLQNILVNPQVALIFIVPGTEETLRVQGRAELTADPVLAQQLAARGQTALLTMRVSIDKCFFHCARAFKRANLWQTASWPPRQPVSFGKQIAPRLGGGQELAQQIDDIVEAGYKHDL